MDIPKLRIVDIGDGVLKEVKDISFECWWFMICNHISSSSTDYLEDW